MLRCVAGAGAGAGAGSSADDLVAAAEAREARTRDVFQRFDADKNGYLDQTELAALLHDMHFDEADVATEFALADKGGDGKIDYNEFVAFYNNITVR